MLKIINNFILKGDLLWNKKRKKEKALKCLMDLL